MHILQNFKEKNCYGCLACVNICPTGALEQGKDEYGFVIPKIIEEKCINCKRCKSVCPYINHIEERSPIEVYAAINKRSDIVINSSSGGIFSAIAEFFLENAGSVFGVTMGENFKVEHICIEDSKELYKIQKSKYVQSNINNTYKLVKEKLSTGKKVLFSGTPCQVAGLKSFLGEDNKALVCLDVVCHGVPSQDLFCDYINHLESKVGRIKKYGFRAKIKERNGMNLFFFYQLENGKKKVKNWPEDSFNFFYMRGLIYRESCYNCKFAKKERISDITLCDYWGWEKYHSFDFKAESTISGCLINTQKGKALFEEIANKLYFVQTKYENLARHNGCLISPTIMNPKRKVILTMWKNKGYKKIDLIFKKKMRKQIIKYSILRKIPAGLKQKLVEIKNMEVCK